MEMSGQEVYQPNSLEIVSRGDIRLEHCYVAIHTKTTHHLLDHNYFNNRRQVSKTSQNRKSAIKITELRAIYNCKACGYRTMNRDIFSKHTCPQHTLKYIACKSCDKNNTPKGYVKCPQCSYYTKNTSSLKVHLRIHSKGTPYKCTECEFSGRDLKELIRHYENIKDLVCGCGYSTHVKQQMVAHKRSHTGEKPFSCGICRYSAADRGSLHRHLKRHES